MTAKPVSSRNFLNWLIPLVGILALIAAAAGLLWQEAGSPFTFTTLHGQTAQLQGWGLYRYDTLFTGAAFRGTDAATIFVCLPLLVVSFVLYRRGLLRGRLLLTSVLSFFLYNSASMALSAAYNNLFLLYIVFFSASLFAFVLALASIDLQSLPAHISPRLPRRGIAAFLFAACLLPLFIWLGDLVGALVQNTVPPLLGSYTTMVTYVLDLGIITPVVFVSAVLLLQRTPLGYLLAPILLILNALVGVAVIGQTVAQLFAGVPLGTGQLIGLVGSWVIMGSFAVWMAAAVFRNLSEAAEYPPAVEHSEAAVYPPVTDVRSRG